MYGMPSTRHLCLRVGSFVAITKWEPVFDFLISFVMQTEAGGGESVWYTGFF